MSAAQLVFINISNDETDDDEDDSGSLAWLSLLALPFLARRKAKK
ncbi:GlyGly-CTERM sorting domain-containing protein [Streptomyces scabiei]